MMYAVIAPPVDYVLPSPLTAETISTGYVWDEMLSITRPGSP